MRTKESVHRNIAAEKLVYPDITGKYNTENTFINTIKGCQIFPCTPYQNRKKLPNGHKIYKCTYQIAFQYS
jgi:hypothetical protein